MRCSRFGKSGFDLSHALPRDKIWMVGHQPIGQLLDDVGILFFYKSSAHVGTSFTASRKSSTAGNIVQCFDWSPPWSGWAFSPGGSPPRSCRLTCWARFVARLLLSALSTNNALIVTAGWTRFRLRHALL